MRLLVWNYFSDHLGVIFFFYFWMGKYFWVSSLWNRYLVCFIEILDFVSDVGLWNLFLWFFLMWILQVPQLLQLISGYSGGGHSHLVWRVALFYFNRWWVFFFFADFIIFVLFFYRVVWEVKGACGIFNGVFIYGAERSSIWVFFFFGYVPTPVVVVVVEIRRHWVN